MLQDSLMQGCQQRCAFTWRSCMVTRCCCAEPVSIKVLSVRVCSVRRDEGVQSRLNETTLKNIALQYSMDLVRYGFL